MGVPTLLLLYMGVKLGQEWCGDSPASAKVRVDLPSSKVRVHLPSSKVRVHLPSSKVRVTGQFKGQVHCPIQKSGYSL